MALLNSDTEVPQGWLRRLAAQAYAEPRIASVSPFSNNATICGYPRDEGGPLPLGLDLGTIDAACRSVNAGRSVAVPTTVGFCMYIRRAALDEVGGFDAKAFGRGYGEENDFCMRAAQRGWTHRLACDTFVFHEGAVSFGAGKDKLLAEAQDALAQRYPDYARIVAQHVKHGRGGAVPLRGHRRAVPPHGPAGRADVVAPDWAAACSGTSTNWSRGLPAAPMCCCCRPPCAACALSRAGAAQRVRCWRCRGSGWTTSSRCCAPPRCRACTCIT